MSSVTGRLEPREAPAWQRLAFRYLVSFPIIGLCLALVFVVMFVMLQLQVKRKWAKKRMYNREIKKRGKKHETDKNVKRKSIFHFSPINRQFSLSLPIIRFFVSHWICAYTAQTIHFPLEYFVTYIHFSVFHLSALIVQCSTEC